MKRLSTRTILLIVAALCECGAYVIIAHARYTNQLLPTEYFDYTKTGNVLYGLYTAGMLYCFLRIAIKKNGSLAALRWLAGLSAVSLLLVLIPRPLSFLSYDWITGIAGGLKIVNLGLATTLEGHEHLSAIKTTFQHTGIVFIFLFGGTLVYGVITPTDVPSSQQADAAVILGAAVWSRNRPSPVLRMRIYKAKDLWSSKIVPKIVCTGSNAYGERTEAAVERTELIKEGVDSSSIILESKSNSTIEQVLYMRDSLQQRDFHSFIVVSDHFHLQRALEMCRFNNVDALGAASESSLGWEFNTWYRIRDAAALLQYWVFGV